MPKLFSVVDIETNGGFSKTGKITEIAILVTDGEKIISEFSSLINPECYIPPFITNLTGITNEMVEEAPKFYEIAKNIVEITKETVFVAHNVKFDYNFIKQEFAQLGYEFKMETLCTLNLSRKLFKGHKSYSLGNICNDLGIDLKNRHRAYGDARATVDLFNLILKYDLDNFDGQNINGFPITALSKNFDLSKLKNIPEKYGVYYFYNFENEIIYIGKSKNINSAILSFFRNKKNDKIKSQITDIDYMLTSCEIITQLKEVEEISKHKPIFNRRKRESNNWGIYFYEDEDGYIRFYIENTKATEEIPLVIYYTRKDAEDNLSICCNKYNLCYKLCGLYNCAGECFYYGLGECKGACCGKESTNDYNKRVENLISVFNLNMKNAYIMIENCNDNKIGFISIRNYKYTGYCIINKDSDLRPEDIEDEIENKPETKETRQIIFSYLKNTNNYRIIPLP